MRFPAIAKAVLTLPCESALIDGEAAYVLPSGVTDFKSLQEHIDKPDPAIRYFAFDLLSLDGKDLRKEPLSERKEKLRKLMAAKGVSDFLIYSDHVLGDGPAFFDKACSTQLEGIMSKRADAPYRSGRGKSWLKVKCTRSQEFVIGGFAESDVRGKPFSALLLGVYDGEALIFAGKVGTGFNARDLKALAARFKPLIRKTSPFESVPGPERKGAMWLRPELVCAVNFTEWTRDGRLRHPSFQGLREDKPARAVIREGNDTQEAAMPAKTKSAAANTKTAKTSDVTFGDITLSSPDKVLYPDIGFTKLDLARYYESVASVMLPYVAKRPISLVRCPEGVDGERFFQRHAMKGMSKAIKEVAIPGGETKKPYLYIDERGRAVRAGADRHPRDPRLGRVAREDRRARPSGVRPRSGRGSRLRRCCAPRPGGARLSRRARLQEFPQGHRRQGLAFGRAAHAEGRLGRGESVRQGGRRCAGHRAAGPLHGQSAQAARASERSSSTIYATSAAARRSATTPRARKAGAPVACPLRWDELKRLDSGAPYDVETLPARLKRLKTDPWEDFFTTRQSITAKAKKALGLD